MTALAPAWLRGPVPGIAAPLQPVAHALIEVAGELPAVLAALTPEQTWARPAGIASVGFHVVHLSGSLDRLFTYARGEALTGEQQAALAAERVIDTIRPSSAELLQLLNQTLDAALEKLRDVPETSLFGAREVGRARLPATTLGLYFHAAEHSARHAGQIVTTARLVRAQELPPRP